MTYKAWIGNAIYSATDVDDLHRIFTADFDTNLPTMQDVDVINKRPFEAGVVHVSYGTNSSKLGDGNIPATTSHIGTVGLDFSGLMTTAIPSLRDFSVILIKLLHWANYLPFDIRLDLTKALIADNDRYFDNDIVEQYMVILQRFHAFMRHNNLLLTHVTFPDAIEDIFQLTGYQHCVFLINTK